MAAAAFRRPPAELLVAHGADWRATNRRGAQPHLLGRGHEAEGVMQEALGAGLRRTVGPTPAKDADWPGAAQALLAWDAGAPGVEGGFTNRQGKRHSGAQAAGGGLNAKQAPAGPVPTRPYAH